ncbi:metal-sulfur cluster assembly factor [Microbacterium sp. SY138]|uniref:metal-sulfur cluster assembly factor n=1 Tax=unclassified Microbacterium TaxID=2609290 RepID=UPI00321AF026
MSEVQAPIAPEVLGVTRYEKVVDALTYVFDPELSIDIVNLGLVYDVAFDEDDVLIITMTLTSAGCPLTDVIEGDIAEALEGVVEAFRINWVWMPPWGPERITLDGIEMLSALGFAVRR